MDAISFTAAKANLADTMEKVCNDHMPIIITHKNEAPVIMMSLEDYNAMRKKFLNRLRILKLKKKNSG